MAARISKLLLPVLVVSAALPAYALQPLDEFVTGGRAHAPDNLEAVANRDVADGQAGVALGRVLPGVRAQGTYTRNQYESVISLPAEMGMPAETVTITPKDQLDLFLTANVTLVDLAGFWRVKSARLGHDAAEKNVEATLLAVDSQVVQDFYQLVANVALREQAIIALNVAKESYNLTDAQLKAGRVAELDLERARAEVERDVQQVAEADLQVTLSAQALESLTGVKPDLTKPVSIDDDLHSEPPLDQIAPPLDKLPAVGFAVKNRESADASADAQRLQLVPTLTGSFTEHVTNASGFTGTNAVWQAVLALTWTFDYTNIAGIKQQDATVRVTQARERRARLAANDALVRSYATVASNITRSRSARVGVQAANRASDLARERYKAGATTQLELLQAQRDAFAAEVSRIQSDADLVNARVQLRLAAGQEVATPAPKP